MNTSNILKSGLAVAFAAVVGFGCSNERPESNPTDDVSTSEAIVDESESAANLNNPRPAPIGDTAVTGEQADQFGNMNPNVDSAAREMQKLDEQKRRKE